MAQDPQAYVDDQGNEYVREGNRWRVIRPGQQPAAPQAGPQQGPIPGLIQMETPQQRVQAEERAYDRQRDVVRDDRADLRDRLAIESATRQAEAADRTAAKLTEDQGKAGGYAQLMADAERSYQEALRQGFNPTGFRAGAANFTDNIPMMGGVGNFIRDDAGDRARQAELQWSDAQLKAMSGAASPEAEVARNNITFFARPGQSYDAIGERLEDARRVAFESSRRRAGPDMAGLQYPETDPSNGPTVNDGRTVMPADDALAVAPGEYAADYVAHFDRDGDNRASVEEMEAAGWSFDHGAGKWMPPGNGSSPPPPAGPQAPQGGGAGGGGIADLILGGNGQVDRSNPALQNQIEARQQARRDAMPMPLRVLANGYRDFEAFAAGAAEQIPFLDEAAAWTAAQLGGDSYSDVRAANADQNQYERENHGAARNAGGIAGAVAPLAVGGGVVNGGRYAIARAGAGAPRAERLGRFAARAGQNAAAGAGYAGLYGAGAGEGGAGDRLDAAGRAAPLGAALGPVAPYVPGLARGAGRIADDVLGNVPSRAANAVGGFATRQAGRVGNALGVPGSQELINRGTGNALAPLAGRVADRLGADRVNALAPRAQGLRDQAIEPTFIDALDDGGQGMIRAAASRQTPARDAAREFAEGRAAGLQDRVSYQARRTISDDPRSPTEIRSEVGARRTAEADQAFGAVRGDVIAPEREVIDALRAPALRPAIEDAATAALNRGDSETANMLRQLTDGALDNPNGVQITVGMADRLARSLNGRAEAFQRSGNNDAAASYFALGERLRGSARQQVPGYDSALNAYAADSRLLSASELGEQFMSMEADQFAAAIARLAPEERQIAQAAARRAVERQAGTQGQAPGVAQRLSNGREQGARTQALTGDAAPVQQAMGAELQTLRNARNIDPRGGSQTSLNLQDAGGLAGIGSDVAAVARNPLAGGLQIIANRFTSRGFNDQEAQQLVEMAIDPSRTNEMIDLMSRHMTRREARNLARATRYQVLTTTQTGQQTAQ